MVLLVSRVAESDHRKGKQNEILHRLLVAQTDHTKELLDADFVLRTLQRHGIGPYLPWQVSAWPRTSSPSVSSSG